MKLILKIARTELRNLFYSPVAWFLMLIFVIICAYFYSAPMEQYANMQDSLLRTTPDFKSFGTSLTNRVFMQKSSLGFITNIFDNLYLFIPLLTMGLINREFNSGTVKLLYSSPVKLTQIVWGKYISVMVFNLVLMTIMILFMMVGAFSIQEIDFGHLISGLIAFYLMVCTYTAIGMFMSSITNYQIVSAIATFMLLFVLKRIGSLWQEYDFIRDVIYFLSIEGRSERMIKGLITTRDVMYYVLLTYMFVTFSYLSLLHGRDLVSIRKKTMRYAAVFLSVLVVGYLTSRPGYIGYWDSTRIKTNTINYKTQDILKKMQDETLEVTLYTNLLDKSVTGFSQSRPSNRNHYVWEIWDKYVRFKPNIKLNYVLYYDVEDGDSTFFKKMPGMSLDSIAKETAKMKETNFDRYMNPAAIRKIIDLSPEGFRPVMELKYKGRKLFLRTYNDPEFWPSEYHFAAAFKRLSNDTIPRIYASTGNLERNIHKLGEREHNYYSIQKLSRPSLINNGFEVDTIDLNQHDIPEDADALVLADPKVDLNDTVTHRLQQYIGKGGNLLIMGEPGKQHVLNPLIKSVGVQLMPGTIVQISKHETPDKATPYVTMPHTGLLKQENMFSWIAREAYLAGNPNRILHAGAAALSFTDSGFEVTRLMVAGPKGTNWVKAGHLVIDSSAPVFAANEGDYILDSFDVALALNRKINNKDQRITIVGDADFSSNMRGPSQVLTRNYISWMANESYPVNLFGIQPLDTLLTINQKVAKTQKVLFVWILPAAILLLGTLLLLRRKRQ